MFHHSKNDETQSAKIQSIKQTLASVDLSRIRDNIYAGLDSQHAVLQNFEFLKIARKHLSKVIENEFDDLGLFSLKDYIIEHSILKKTSNQTDVLGILIKKTEAKHLVELLKALSLKCRTIDLNALAIQNLLPYAPKIQSPSNQDPAALHFVVNIGHSKTSIVILRENKVVLERSFNLAGHYITTRIKQKCQITYEEAESLKHKISSSIEYRAEHADQAKQILIECANEIAREIDRIIIAQNQNEEEKTVNSIVLMGGSAKFVEFAKIIEKTIGIPTSNLNLTSAAFQNDSEIECIYEEFGQAIALGLRATGARTNSQINIRHGDLALISDYENLIAKIIKYTKLAVILLICLVGTYALRVYLYNNKINQIKTLFNAQISSYFKSEPLELRAISAKANWDFNEYSEKSWKIINENYEQKTEFISELNSNYSMMPLVVLNEISRVVPKELYFEVKLYKFQDGVLSIQAESDSEEDVEEIIAKISSIELLNNVQKKSEAPKPGTAGKLITFSILATLNPKEGT